MQYRIELKRYCLIQHEFVYEERYVSYDEGVGRRVMDIVRRVFQIAHTGKHAGWVGIGKAGQCTTAHYKRGILTASVYFADSEAAVAFADALMCHDALRYGKDWQTWVEGRCVSLALDLDEVL